jgi:hypothetical protein
MKFVVEIELQRDEVVEKRDVIRAQTTAGFARVSRSRRPRPPRLRVSFYLPLYQLILLNMMAASAAVRSLTLHLVLT